MLRRLVIVPILPLSLLAACGDTTEAEQSDQRTASGEVQEGTISDAMLPLDTVTSQPPLLQEEKPKKRASSGGGAATGPAEETPEAPEPAEAEESEGPGEAPTVIEGPELTVE